MNTDKFSGYKMHTENTFYLLKNSDTN